MATTCLSSVTIKALIERRGLKPGVLFYDKHQDHIQVAVSDGSEQKVFTLPHGYVAMSVKEFDDTFVNDVVALMKVK